MGLLNAAASAMVARYGMAAPYRSALVIVGEVAVEHGHAEAGRALVVEIARLLGPDHAGNVEMRPFHALLDEALEEAGSGDRAALARGAVAHVGDLAVHDLVVNVAHRHAPKLVAGGEAG